MAQALMDDWQSNKSLAETNRYMWINKICCDVVFHVGQEQEEIQAHKYILMSRSIVFHTMFNGSLPESTNKPIVVPDIDPDTFKQLCLFLYTETIPITPDNVLSLLHAGKRYMVQSLIDKCLQRLNAKMKQGNLCLIMEASHIFGEPDLREKCRKDIIQNPKQVLPSETLAELCTECLESVIQDDDLRMEEEEIFEYMVKYSENKCLKEDLPVTPENQRKVLGKAIQQIRFTLMDKNYFSDVVEPSGLLKHDESVAVLKYFLNPQSVPVPFSASHRNLHKIVKRFQTHCSGWTYNYRHNADAITCKCSEDIQILGVLTYGSSDRPKEFDAKISIKTAMNATKVMQVFKVKSNGSTKIYDCIFNRPVQIPKEEKFTIVLEMKPGKTTYFGEDGQEKVESEEVTFTFMHSTCSLNNTTCARGQIPGIIYCLDRP